MAQLRDFCGFQWNGKHSSDLNIVRVSEGSRYSENLLPNFQDKTSQMAGSDGTLYWESFYTNKSWTINIAFDNLSETNYRELRQWLNSKDRGELIFDEAPYKAYTAKIQNPPQLKFICFEEKNEDKTTRRIYKGEGTIQFISYYPFARGIYKFKGNIPETIKNTEEWIGASGLDGAAKDNYNSFSNGSCNLYNAGDLSTDFELIVNIGNNPTNITLRDDSGNEIGSLNFSLTAQGNDTYVRFNSATQLIEGLEKLSSGGIKLTGNLYNRYITSGDWFKIPVGESVINITEENPTTDIPTIDYDYLYY